MSKAKPIGELKKVVSLVDRTDFDEYVYPQRSQTTKFQPEEKTYQNYVQETVVWPFMGGPSWGQRITLSVPFPWEADFLHAITLRLKPQSWLTADAIQHIGPAIGDYVLLDPDNFWIWANSLGTIAIELAEMEVDGVIIESFTGDWIDVWNKTHHSCTSGIAYDEITGYKPVVTKDNILSSEDGYVYCHLPFWFSKFPNTAFPLVSCSGPNKVRFHITLRPFADVVRKLNAVKACKEVPTGQSFQVRDYSFTSARVFKTIDVDPRVPDFEVADMMCSVSHMDEPLRTAYRTKPHEILMAPVVESTFSEPFKYVVNTTTNTIKIGLPLTTANGPIRQLLFFLRRNATKETNDWTNYGRALQSEIDPVWNPQGPLLQHAQLMVGTAIWADEDEQWWRASMIDVPGGIRAYGNYIYAYNFASAPTQFEPSGSVNASRVDMRLNLTVAPVSGPTDGEWTVTVFLVGTNWIRFENGLANFVFMD